MTQASTPVVLTKDEKLAKIKTQIAKLEARYDDVLNDRVTAKAAKAPAYLPEVGDRVIATVGRNTATSQAKSVEGVVTAVKPATIDANTGKTVSAAQVRVRINEGTFDEQLVTLYPAQLTKVQEESAPE